MAGRNDPNYWARRMRLMEEALLDRGYGYVDNMERQFRTAQAEVERQIAVWYARFAANNEMTLADAKRLLAKDELAELRWTVGEYIAYGQRNALDGAWMKQLENASARVHISRLEAIKLQIQQQAEVLYANQLDAVDAAAREMYVGSYLGTAFELQKGLGVGWTMQAINEAAIAKVLSRPWTADNLTFRDRCWTNKQALVNAVNTQLTQMIIRGEAPDKAIAAISHQFNVSKTKAGRLIMTEAAAFSSAAQKDCYDALEVERYKVVETFDQDTCELCGGMDGQVFKMSEYQVGLTAPPFHPWCRGCTAPYFEDMAKLGERWSRNPDGTAEKVPADMSFEEWKERFVRDGGLEKGLTEIFRPMGDYIKPDGSFNMEAAKADYEKFLQTVPEKNRIYLQQAMAGVEYKRIGKPTKIFAYDTDADAILFNPDHPFFGEYDFQVANTHELGHRIDRFFVHSSEQSGFMTGIRNAEAILDTDPDLFVRFCEQNDKDGFLSDIMSAICKGRYRFPMGHDTAYWSPEKQAKEIFTNLFGLESCNDIEKLSFLKEHFPGLIEAFSGLEYLI